MKEKKASGYEAVPGDVLKLLREDGLQKMAKLINAICVKLENVPWISLRYGAYLNEKAKSYKMHRSSHNQTHRTYRKK